MWLCSLFLHVPNAAAAPSGEPIVLSVGAEVSTGLGGGWARAWPEDDGSWRFLWSAGGDYVRLPMTADLVVTDRDRTALTGRTNLVDHAITRCPDDGSFLHAASANVDSYNDSAYAFRFDPDLGLTGETTIAERDTSRAHNDMTVLCSGPLSGVGFAERGGSVFFPIAADATLGAMVSLPDAPSLMGGAMYHEAESDTILVINFRFHGPLVVARYTTDLTLVEVTEIPDAVEAPLTGYWAQGLLRVGDVYVVAHMARDESRGWAADEGDVWLAFFDTDWNLLERRQISQNTPPTGGMRPGLARRGEQLLVFYDKQVSPYLFDVRLDLAAMGVEGEEPDSGRSDVDDDSGGPGGDTEGCGCDTGAAPLSGLGVLAALFVRRRRAAS
jgi:hypothetical protein